MSTTTIRIDDDLRERVATAAERAGKSPHASIVEAIAATVNESELREAFYQIGTERWQKIAAGGKTVSMQEMSDYVSARTKGHKPKA
jgi:predicted transcriptional regulator